mgnify:CR=1 FL=1
MGIELGPDYPDSYPKENPTEEQRDKEKAHTHCGNQNIYFEFPCQSYACKGKTHQFRAISSETPLAYCLSCYTVQFISIV